MNSINSNNFSDYLSVTSNELETLVGTQDGTKVLSLDCFDTLLWRTVSRPTDVFLSLQERPLYLKHKLNARIRERAESACRRLNLINDNSSEVSINQIYRYALSEADDQVIQDLVDLELSEEALVCYIFRPAFDLLTHAKSIGLKTIIVSDSYLSSIQLTKLINSAIKVTGKNNPIDEVFTSSDFGCSKSDGLLGKVSKLLNVSPGAILHVGDNRGADFDGARRDGVRGIHFVRHCDEVENLVRMASSVAKLLEPDLGRNSPNPTLHQHTWAGLSSPVKAEEIVGWCSLGPVMVNYMRWVSDHVKTMIQEGQSPRLVFLMRDGFLPHEFFKLLSNGNPELSNVPAITADLSRFVATACSFTGRDKIQDYFRSGVSTNNPTVALNQLLFNGAEIKKIAGRYGKTNADWQDFCGEMISISSVRIITKRSHDFRRRFLRYFEQQVQPKIGETLVFVDLGYAGTIQNLLGSLIEKNFGVTVLGKYLLLQDVAKPPKGIEGFLSSKHIDIRALETLLSHIKTLEQLCCNSNPSTVDYEEDGTPVYKSSTISQKQKDIRAKIQESALKFGEISNTDTVLSLAADITAKRDTLALLGRLLMLPTEIEAQLLSSFSHDVNLGTSVVEIMNDPEQTKADLRRRGLMYLNGTDRSAPAHELVVAGSIDLPLFNLATNRFGLDIRISDFQNNGKNKIKIIVSDGQDFTTLDLTTYSTHEGFQLLLVPLPATASGVGILLGQVSRWIQIDSATVSDLDTIFHTTQSRHVGIDVTNQLTAEFGHIFAGQLIEFKDKSGLVFSGFESDLHRNKNRQQVYALVYRELVAWEPASNQSESEST